MKIKKVFDTKCDYTLLQTDGTCEPFVVAWKFDKKRGDWAQGHYFSDLFSAKTFFNNRNIDFAW